MNGLRTEYIDICKECWKNGKIYAQYLKLELEQD